MTAPIGLESSPIRLHAESVRALATPRAAPLRADLQPAETKPDRIPLRSDAPPFELRISAAAQGLRAAASATTTMTAEDKAYLEDLRARDREVRAHEQAHANAGGIYAGVPEYDYVTGPDGRPYAIGGEVKIDVSPVPDDPEATIEKMVVVKEAALAPREPSEADRQVAAKADGQRRQAEGDLRAEAFAGEADSGIGPAAGSAAGPAGDESVGTRPFADVAASYREATAFFAMSVEAGSAAVLA